EEQIGTPVSGPSCEPDEARGSPRREAYFLYVDRRGRPSNEGWRRKLARSQPDAIEHQTIQPVLHLHRLEELGGRVEMEPRGVEVAEATGHAPQQEMAAGREWPHAERLREGERLVQMATRRLHLRRLLLGGDEADEPVGVDLVAPLAPLRRQHE